jgi:hypothetical protein
MPGIANRRTASLPLAYDPRIHQSSEIDFTEMMDCRVKPGNDELQLAYARP